ncbi:MAG TPA: phosphatase PAP2 family protein [Thermoanaerobaculia bacterium]
MTDESVPPAATRWGMVAETLGRPYPVTVWMVLFVSMIPFYVFIGDGMRGRASHYPELALDRLIPLQPSWVLVYGTLYFYLIALPWLTIRQPAHIRRMVFAYLLIWITAYACFLLFPSEARRPDVVPGDGFGARGLRFLYESDTPRNCFPSLHVAHSFVSALACWRLHRRVGMAAIAAASVVAVSTLFTKQHYLLDILGGIGLAFAAYLIFLRGYRRADAPDLDRRAAPLLAAGLLAVLAVALAGLWAAYRLFG